jgi:hypothetical protein
MMWYMIICFQNVQRINIDRKSTDRVKRVHLLFLIKVVSSYSTVFNCYNYFYFSGSYTGYFFWQKKTLTFHSKEKKCALLFLFLFWQCIVSYFKISSFFLWLINIYILFIINKVTINFNSIDKNVKIIRSNDMQVWTSISLLYVIYFFWRQ